MGDFGSVQSIKAPASHPLKTDHGPGSGYWVSGTVARASDLLQRARIRCNCTRCDDTLLSNHQHHQPGDSEDLFQHHNLTSQSCQPFPSTVPTPCAFKYHPFQSETTPLIHALCRQNPPEYLCCTGIKRFEIVQI